MMWEVYWTAGYTVRGSSDVIVDKYCRTEAAAQKKARAAADTDVARLISLGLEGNVTLWTEQWRTRRFQESFDRKPFDEVKTERRREEVEIREEDKTLLT